MARTTDLPGPYIEFFACFNRQQYFEAHEVLETLWLDTRDARRDFYKGLIQTAAVFLKLAQGKRDPAARLAGRALAHIGHYPPVYEQLDVAGLTRLLQDVRDGRDPLAEHGAPRLELIES